MGVPGNSQYSEAEPFLTVMISRTATWWIPPDFRKVHAQVNSEFYTGWLDHWGDVHAFVKSENITSMLMEMFALGVNVNMYMFEGGTNFGYWNGAEFNERYLPVVTSYDYDAPLSEAGDPTEKLFAIKSVISKFFSVPAGPMPPPTQKYAYGYISLKKVSCITELLDDLCPQGPVHSYYPITFEEMKQSAGYRIPKNDRGTGPQHQLQALQQAQAATTRELEATKARLVEAQRARPDPTKLTPPPLVPLTDVEAYLGVFERTATRNEWQRSEWASILAPFLKGPAQRAYYDLPEEEAASYDLLKSEILARYGITPAQQASEWRNWAFDPEKPARAQALEVLGQNGAGYARGTPGSQSR
ncbi:BGAL galactosidase, partial [Polypterus senegalus]